MAWGDNSAIAALRDVQQKAIARRYGVSSLVYTVLPKLAESTAGLRHRTADELILPFVLANREVNLDRDRYDLDQNFLFQAYRYIWSVAERNAEENSVAATIARDLEETYRQGRGISAVTAITWRGGDILRAFHAVSAISRQMQSRVLGDALYIFFDKHGERMVRQQGRQAQAICVYAILKAALSETRKHECLERILRRDLEGIYQTACNGLTSRAEYVAKELSKVRDLYGLQNDGHGYGYNRGRRQGMLHDRHPSFSSDSERDFEPNYNSDDGLWRLPRSSRSLGNLRGPSESQLRRLDCKVSRMANTAQRLAKEALDLQDQVQNRM